MRLTHKQRMQIKPEPRIPFTKQGYEKVLEEKAALIQERPDAVEHLRKAREMGDLRENGYYKEARARLSFIDARLRRIDRLAKLGIIVEDSGSGTVEIGTKVTLTDGTQEFTYSIVGGYESDPKNKTISYVSPIGKAVMGKREKDTVEVFVPAGVRTFTIVTISSA